MKTIEVRKNSWHYWLADMGDYDPNAADICTYIRSILKAVVSGILIVVLGGSLAGFFVWIVADFLAWFVFVILHGWIAPEQGIGVIFAAGVGSIIGGPYFAWRGTKRVVQDSEVLHAAWDSVHDHICARITFR